MFDRIARWQPDRGAAVAVRAVGALALIALAVIHVVDLPGTLGPNRLVASVISGSSPRRSWSAGCCLPGRTGSPGPLPPLWPSRRWSGTC
jgi:hypothetical protein